MQLFDSHPSNRELLLAADGELPGRRAAQIAKHLAGCWECRLRARELETAIGEFVHLHRLEMDALLPAVAGRRALLRAQLNEVSRSQPRFAWSVAVCLLALLLMIAVPYRSSRSVRSTYAGFVPVSFPMTTLTPGVARRASLQQLCGSNDGKNRDVPIALRRKVFELYGIDGADPEGYEVDYLITPALGGADDIGNLWPQSYSSTVWNARVKDALEDRLHEMVCSGEIDLATAQREISSDWIAAYRKYFRTDRPVN